jgi:hypothetical protein
MGAGGVRGWGGGWGEVWRGGFVRGVNNGYNANINLLILSNRKNHKIKSSIID